MIFAFAAPNAYCEAVKVKELQSLVQVARTRLANDVVSKKFLTALNDEISDMVVISHVRTDSCVRNKTENVVIYAFAKTSNPQGRDPNVYLCDQTADFLNHDQLTYVLLHENAHRLGVKNELEANYVAERILALNGISHPFLLKDEEIAAHFLQTMTDVQASLKNEESFAINHDLVKKYFFNSLFQAFDLRPYRGSEIVNSAHADFFRFGDRVTRLEKLELR
jgi:hypothetical protein